MQTHMTQRILMEIVFASVTKCEADLCFTGTSWGTLRGFSKQSAFAAMQTAVLFVVQDGASDGKSITDTLENLATQSSSCCPTRFVFDGDGCRRKKVKMWKINDEVNWPMLAIGMIVSNLDQSTKDFLASSDISR